jgi:hypothetical protein
MGKMDFVTWSETARNSISGDTASAKIKPQAIYLPGVFSFSA